MRIEYAENPLATKVFLDTPEKKLLFWRYVWEMLDEEIYNFYYWMEDPEKQKNWYKELNNLPALQKLEALEKDLIDAPLKTVHEILSKVWEKMITMKYDESKIESFIEALQSEHDGDCVYQACSCLKCWAEYELDIVTVPDTKKGFWGGVASTINSSFFNPETQKKDRTIEQAIDYLKTREYKTQSYSDVGSGGEIRTVTYDEETKNRLLEKRNQAVEYLEYYKKEVLGK